MKKLKRYKCCLCKKEITASGAYFHHFTETMIHKYQCIKCRWVTPEAIAHAKAEHKKFTEHHRWLKKLTGPHAAKFAKEYLDSLKKVPA